MRRKSIRVLIAGANTYNPNKGVVALATSTVCLFYEILSEISTDFEICIYNREFKRELDVIYTPDGGCIRYRNIYPTDIFTVSGFIKTLFSKSKLYYLKEFLKCDFVFNIAAGDGFSDIYGKEVLLSLSKINKLCRWFHKPYYMLPQTYGPFLATTSLEFAKKECLSAKLLMARDKDSAELLNNEFGCTNVFDLIDVAFALPYRELKKDTAFIHIGINISETLCSKHDDSGFSVSPDYFMVMKEVICKLLSEGYKVHLIPHVVNVENRIQNEYFIHYRLWEELQHPNLIIPPLFLSASDAKSYISSMDLFIGSRMHACIAAFSSNVPVLLLGYSRKFSGLFCNTLDYHYLIDVAEGFTVDKVEKKISEMLRNLLEIKSSIREHNLTTVREKLVEMRKIITEIIQ